MRYWHTLRHLKPIQFYARTQIYLFNFFKLTNKVSLSSPELRPHELSLKPPIEDEVSLIGEDHFRFLNLEHKLPEINGWNDPKLEKLWIYNLHYFSDLTAQDSIKRISWHKDLVAKWIDQNPPGFGNGWEPYPISLRIINWIKWSLNMQSSPGFQVPNRFSQSLAVQTQYLMKNLEWHLLGNHLFANAKALVFSGAYFQGKEADDWLKKGLQIIADQLEEQVLADGGNFERSPMYHAIFLEDLLDLINIAQTYPNLIDSKLVDHWNSRAKKMLYWLAVMSHPDNQISLFNDAAFKVAPTLHSLREYALRLQLDIDQAIEAKSHAEPFLIEHLKESGYIRLTTDIASAFLDVAPIGPDYLPGHAHADTLSFELSLFGQRVIVNGGTSRYGIGAERLRERQTVSHSTVEVDGQSSSEVWGGFRVARRAYPLDLKIAGNENQVTVSCSHDGYKRLAGKPLHRRTWVLNHHSIEIQDEILGGYSQARARFIIHPEVEIIVKTQGAWQLVLPNGELASFVVEQGEAYLENAFYAPEFGKVINTNCIVVDIKGGFSNVQIGWN